MEPHDPETTICDYCVREIDLAEAYNHEGGVACPDCFLDALLDEGEG